MPGREGGGGGWEGILGSLLSLRSVEKRRRADAEDLVFTADFLRLGSQSVPVQGSAGRCEGEVRRRRLLVAEGALKGRQLTCAFEGSSGKGHENGCHPGDQR